MRKKLNSEAGLTVVEMLAATVILILLALILNTGLEMVARSYQTVIARNEVELLLSSALDAVAGELRYARETDSSGGSGFFTYDSDSYGEGVSLGIGDAAGKYPGQIVAKKGSDEFALLPTGTYGHTKNGNERSYRMTMGITPVYSGTNRVSFTINLKVTDGTRSAETPGGVTVRCLNPPKEP